MPDQIERELEKLNEEIQSAKSDIANEEGSVKTNEKRLSDEFKIVSLDKARAKVQELKKKEVSYDKEIKTTYNKLKEEYEW